MLTAVALVLCALGWLNALYFTLLYYNRPIPSWVEQMPLCNGTVCRQVVRLPAARLAWFPNGLYGLIFYPLIALAAFWPQIGWLEMGAMLTATLAGVIGFYLIYALWQARIVCWLCLLAHAINLTLWLLLWAM